MYRSVGVLVVGSTRIIEGIQWLHLDEVLSGSLACQRFLSRLLPCATLLAFASTPSTHGCGQRLYKLNMMIILYIAVVS